MKLKTTTRSDGSTIYTTIEGDMVDDIAFRYYGRHRNNTQILYEANERLVGEGPVLPSGIEIVLPPPPQNIPFIETVRLFD